MARKFDPDFKEVVSGTLKRLVEKGVIDNDGLDRFMVAIMGGTAPVYHQQDDFTVALLVQANMPDNGKTLALGVSKRNPTDPKSPLRGRSLALSRALKEFVVASVKREAEAKEAKEFKAPEGRVIPKLQELMRR